MRQLLVFLGIIATISFTSCRNELDFEPSIGNLSFSKETVYLDTVFTNIGSSTYTLKVYNNSNKNISIPKVRLGKGQNSNYRLMVDGVPGKEFENVELTNCLYEVENRLQAQIDNIHPVTYNLQDYGLEK